jgi:hypothetical protein
MQDVYSVFVVVSWLRVCKPPKRIVIITYEASSLTLPIHPVYPRDRVPVFTLGHVEVSNPPLRPFGLEFAGLAATIHRKCHVDSLAPDHAVESLWKVLECSLMWVCCVVLKLRYQINLTFIQWSGSMLSRMPKCVALAEYRPTFRVLLFS